MKRLVWIGLVILAATTPAPAGEIEFVEDFSLSTDRSAALKQLVPGTEDFYYYHALHYLNTEQYEQAEQLIEPWVQRHGQTPRHWEIRTRHALLTYEKNPQKSLEYLRNRFGIQFPHQKEELNAEPNLPIALDPALISRKAFTDRANAGNQANLDGFEDTALDWLTGVALSPAHRRSLLSRLQRPDYPNLPKLVADDLVHENSGGFGSHTIHRQLLLAQLEELLKLKPDLLTQQHFVVAYLTKLQPGPDEDWRHDHDALEAFINRLYAFAKRLGPSHNSLRGHVLYHRLVLDRLRGEYDQPRFLEYLRLPRHVGYASKAVLESEDLKRFACDLNAVYEGATLLAPIGDDEPLVRSYLAHFFVDAASAKAFEPYVNDVYLRHLFAETKIVHGLGEPEQWASLLPPEMFQQLRQRIDIDFAFTNKSQFAADAPVGLDVQVKNVTTLIVKVFEINTRNYYREQQREVDTDVNLDGLVANVERTYHYDEPPLRRVTRHFDFPTLDKAGVYVIDLIGNGRSSRALVRKGRLHHLVQTGPAGQVFTVLDERHRQVKNATLWLFGHEYAAGKDGLINVPFSTSPGRQPIVLSAPIARPKEAGDDQPAAEEVYSSLDYFQHEAENYALAAGFYVDREALLRRKTAEVLIRPGLSVNGRPVSLKLLDEVKLIVTSIDLDGTATTQEIPDFELFEDREAIHEFQVPQRLASISFALTAKVKQLSTGGQKIDLAAADTFTLNEIDRTEKIEDLHLVKAAGNYVVELRGKTGESRASRPVVFSIKHRDFRAPFAMVLKTDPAGRVALGSLPEIAGLSATGPDGTAHAWELAPDRHTYPGTVQGREGEPIVLPFLPAGGLDGPKVPDPGERKRAEGGAKSVPRSEVSLIELRGEIYVADRFKHLSVKDGLLVAEKLPAGDYDLFLKSSGVRARVRVAPGTPLGRFVVGKVRQLETPALAPVQIESIEAGDEKLRIQLRNVSEFTRVHLLATRYVPEYDAFALLSRVRGIEPFSFQHNPAESVYLTGRNIGDEYRYIIDRKYARKFPGNMLQRPSLLLNPWAVRVTETGEQVAAGGDDFDAAGALPPSSAEGGAAPSPQGAAGTGHFANLDFLAESSAVLVNLLPDKQGLIEIKLAALGGHQHQHLRVVAVDPLNTTSRSASLAEQAPTIVDLRLATALDAHSHFTQRKQIEIVPAGQEFTLADITTSKFEAYDSLARVYGLYATLNPDPKLTEFAFILRWPKLKPEEKQALYSKYASHELSFFLSKKDPEFFRQVVQPYLANKKDKTFVDRFLLEQDLSEFLGPWKHAQLNVVERIMLAERLKDELPHTARHVGDLYALLPPDIDGFIHLFDTAVKTGSLVVEDALGLKRAGDAVEARSLMFLQTDAPQAAAVAGAMGGGAARKFGAPAPPGASTENIPGGRPEPMAKRRQLQELSDSLKAEKDKAPARDGARRSRLDRLGRTRGGEVEAELAASDSKSTFFDDSLGDREQLRQLYRKLDKTSEWAENNYHHLTIDQQTAALITVNAFWRDYAQHDPATPFLSRHLAAASRNFPEMLLALAVLDLPFESPKHETRFDDAAMTLTPGGPVIIFHEQVQPAAVPDGAAKVLVSQNFFRHGDRQRIENGEPVDKFVTDEFLVHTVYGCQVVITNPTSTRQKLNALVQIPQGAIPVLNGQATRTVHIGLEPYHTQTLEYHFYFPAAGEFPHFPVHVAKNETPIAAAAPVTLSVVDRPTKIDAESWDYVSQYASADDVLRFLATHNVNSLNLDKIAWRMRDAKVFASVISLLTERHVYQHTLWSYALMHDVVPAAREYLQHADAVVNDCGGRLASPLLTVDSVARRTFEHLDYRPLVNARAHALGKRRQIVNDRLHQQYHRLLRELAHSRRLSDDDLLAVTYYLLVQDRIEEAIDAFGRVNADQVAEKMQYDYCAAYLDFFTGEHERARAIAANYVLHPVERWRDTFAVITAQFDEAHGNESQIVDADDRDQQQARLAATEPSFEFTVATEQINLNFQNLATARVNFYEMDVELLFSRNPFVQQFRGQFGAIRPNHVLEITLPEKETEHSIPFPTVLANKNVLVEIVGDGETKTQAYYSHSLAVQVIENYGQIKVTHQKTHQPVTKAYVKVYAQTADGQVKFYKDGYTDLRGRFDYASLNTGDLDVAVKFAILVLSDESGALVREAAPPKR
ncbi:MAG TPA: hypothetical protein VND64_00155 [Pirellulales bacterium]|nr:hypothetical protein [Pirellulales bacterium]